MFELSVFIAFVLLLMLFLMKKELRGALLYLWLLQIHFGFSFLFLGSDLLTVHFWFVGTLISIMIYLHNALMGEERTDLVERKKENLLLIPYGAAGGCFLLLTGWLIQASTGTSPAIKEAMNEGMRLGKGLMIQYGVLTAVFALVLLLVLIGLSEDRRSA